MAAAEVRVVITALRDHVADVVRRFAFEVVANLVAAPGDGGTPVDTGWARNNWIATTGTPFDGLVGSREQAEKGGVDSGQQQTSLVGLLQYTIEDGIVYISNNVPYIQALNEGHSQQAPRYFVQAAVARAAETVASTEVAA